MGAGRDLMNFRRGVDALSNSGKTTAGAINMRTQMTERRTDRIEQTAARETENIVQGVKGVSDAIRQKEIDRQKKETFEWEKRKADQDYENAQAMNPLKQKQTKLDIEATEQDVAIKGSKNEREISEYNRAKDNRDANDKAVVDSYSGKKPAGWDAMGMSEKAAYVAAQNKEKDRQLDQAKGWTDIKTAKLQQDKIETDINGNILDLAKKSDPAQLAAWGKDPNTISMRHVDMNTPAGKAAYERQAKNFDKTKEAAQFVNDRQASVERVAGYGGVKLNPDGTLSKEEADKWQLSGFSGFIKSKTGDPNYKAARAEMGGILAQAAKEGTFGSLNRDSEIKLALEGAGGDPTKVNWTDSMFQEADQLINSNGGAQAFFNRQSNALNDTRSKIRQDFQANDGFGYLSLSERQGVLYNLAPTSYKKAGEKDFINPDQMTPQELARAAFGADPATNKPLYEIPQAWQEDVALSRAIKDGSAYAIQQQSTNEMFWTGDNAKRAAKVAEGRKSIGIAVSGPAAAAGIARNQPLKTGPVGEQVDPVRGSSQTPVVFDPATQGYSVVSQPSGKAAAGATPSGDTDAFKVNVQRKGGLAPDWETKTNSAFGFDKDAYDSGAAYAQ